MVFCNVPSAEQGAEFVVKIKDLQVSQVESLRKMKKHMIEKLNSGGEFQGPKVMVFIQKPVGIQWFPFWHFVMILGQLQNVMLLQESDEVNITWDIEEK